MARKDFYHDTVIAALEADGWEITHDPYRITIGDTDLLVDLAAQQKIIGAQKSDNKIAVEIKNFLGNSDINELEKALGQYEIYRFALEEIEPERILFLAVPAHFQQRLLKKEFFLRLLTTKGIKMIIFDEHKQIVLEWKR